MEGATLVQGLRQLSIGRSELNGEMKSSFGLRSEPFLSALLALPLEVLPILRTESQRV